MDVHNSDVFVKTATLLDISDYHIDIVEAMTLLLLFLNSRHKSIRTKLFLDKLYLDLVVETNKNCIKYI